MFSFVFLVCSFFYLLLLFFAEIGTSFLFIFSVVHSVLLLLKSDHSDRILFVMQSSTGRTIICSARDGLSRVYYICYADILYPSNEGNPLVFWWIAVTLLWSGRGDFSASGLSRFKKIVLTSDLDCILGLGKIRCFLNFYFSHLYFLISVLHLGAFIWLHWLQYLNFPPPLYLSPISYIYSFGLTNLWPLNNFLYASQFDFNS